MHLVLKDIPQEAAGVAFAVPYFIQSMPDLGQHYNGKYARRTVKAQSGSVKVQPSQGCVKRYLGML